MPPLRAVFEGMKGARLQVCEGRGIAEPQRALAQSLHQYKCDPAAQSSGIVADAKTVAAKISHTVSLENPESAHFTASAGVLPTNMEIVAIRKAFTNRCQA